MSSLLSYHLLISISTINIRIIRKSTTHAAPLIISYAAPSKLLSDKKFGFDLGSPQALIKQIEILINNVPFMANMLTFFIILEYGYPKKSSFFASALTCKAKKKYNHNKNVCD
uniref:Uncharacterized protein n=1 Tax=Romanomermis culicivorax TaxID=13658 RepID=A0A915IGW1_ROMCU